ncbi:MAG: DUF4097 family beta strand repeat-containing protein [Acutalibacteraceae bacterium]
MKAVKITIWLVIAALLTATPIFAMSAQNGSSNFFSFDVSGLSGNYKNSSEYKIGSPSISVDNISSVEVNWISGEINVLSSTDNNILFDCPDDKKLEDDYKLRYLVKDGKLTIQYTKPFNVFQQLFKKNIKKTLNIYIPSSVKEVTVNNVSSNTVISDISTDLLEINNVSGEIYLSSLSLTGKEIKRISIDNVSGKMTVNNITTDNLSVNTVSGGFAADNTTAKFFYIDNVSGKINLNGSFDKVEADTVSGDFTINSKTMLSDLAVDGVSAAINITIPENDGFELELDKASAYFKCEFETKNTGDLYIYKNRTSKFEIDTVSGNVNLMLGTQE